MPTYIGQKHLQHSSSIPSLLYTGLETLPGNANSSTRASIFLLDHLPLSIQPSKIFGVAVFGAIFGVPSNLFSSQPPFPSVTAWPTF